MKSVAAVAAGAGCTQETQLIAQGGTQPAGPAGSVLPTLQLGKHRISRMIVGGNPLYGYSHFNRLFSQHMVEWATPDRVLELLASCERHGINTWQFSHTERPMSDLGRHRAAGGKMQWILLSHAEIENDHKLLAEVAKKGPIGIVHHGGSAERKRRAGKFQSVLDFLKAVRQTGVHVGLSTHDPQLLAEAEEKNWDIDFYMTALYYLTRSPEEFRKMLGTRPIGEIYLPEDPARMCAVIRQTRKPCLVYKVLAAGRLADSPQAIDQAFQFVFDNVKPNDGMIIGMYPRYTDQVKENAERVRRILNRESSTVSKPAVR